MSTSLTKSFTLGLMMCGLVWASTTSAPGDAPRRESNQEDIRTVVDGLLSRLAHPRFEVREKSTQELYELGTTALDRLAERYQADPNEEQKLRIRYAVETILYRRQIEGREGFIGIQIATTTTPDVYNPVRDESVYGVFVVQPLAGFPADRAGLIRNDLIVGYNDQLLPHEPGSREAFIQFVERLPVDAPIDIHILRLREPEAIVMTVPNNVRLSEGLSFIEPPPNVTTGPIVKTIGRNHPLRQAGLAQGDVVTTVNASRLEGPGSDSGIMEKLAAAQPGQPIELGVRKWEPLVLKCTLIRRPVELLEPEADIPEAQSRISAWCLEHGLEPPSLQLPRNQPLTFAFMRPHKPAPDPSALLP